MDIRVACWTEGDPIEHRDFFELLDYSLEKGLENNVMSSGVISKKQAKKLVERYKVDPEKLGIGIHIDTEAGDFSDDEAIFFALTGCKQSRRIKRWCL